MPADLSLASPRPDLASIVIGTGGCPTDPDHSTPAWRPPAAEWSAQGSVLTRASSPDYFGWLAHVSRRRWLHSPDPADRHPVHRRTGHRPHPRHPGTPTSCPTPRSTRRAATAGTLDLPLVRGHLPSRRLPDRARRDRRWQRGARHGGPAPGRVRHLHRASFGTVHTRYVKKHTCAARGRCDCRPEPCHARRRTAPARTGSPPSASPGTTSRSGARAAAVPRLL